MHWRQRSKCAKKKRWCTCKVVVLPILTCCFFAVLVNVSTVDISLLKLPYDRLQMMRGAWGWASHNMLWQFCYGQHFSALRVNCAHVFSVLSIHFNFFLFYLFRLYAFFSWEVFSRGYSWKFLVGVCRPVLPISDQKCHFPHSFSDQTSKIHTCFQI